MKIQTLMNELFAWCADGEPHDYSQSCDTLKTGSPETEVRKAAVTMFATPEVIRAAAQHQKVDYTPYEGFEVIGRPRAVYVGGELSAKDGEPTGVCAGRYVKR